MDLTGQYGIPDNLHNVISELRTDECDDTPSQKLLAFENTIKDAIGLWFPRYRMIMLKEYDPHGLDREDFERWINGKVNLNKLRGDSFRGLGISDSLRSAYQHAVLLYCPDNNRIHLITR